MMKLLLSLLVGLFLGGAHFALLRSLCGRVERSSSKGQSLLLPFTLALRSLVTAGGLALLACWGWHCVAAGCAGLLAGRLWVTWRSGFHWTPEEAHGH